MKKKPRIRISKRKIVEFCKRNHIRRLAFFGSVLNGHKVDLRTPRDLSRYFRDDVLVTAEVLYVES